MNKPIFNNQCDEQQLEQIKQATHRSESEAMHLINQGLIDYPTDSRLMLLRGSIYANQRDYDFAHADLSKALVLNPNMHTARFMLGQLELCRSDLVQAVATWLPLTTLDESGSTADFAKGMICMVEGELGHAVQHLERGLQREQSTPEIVPFIQDVRTKIRASMANNNRTDGTEKTESHLLLSGYSTGE